VPGRGILGEGTSVALGWLKGVTNRLRGGGEPARAQREAHRRARDFAKEVHLAIPRALQEGNRAALDALLRKPAELDLPEEEVELELEALHGALDALGLRETLARDGLPVVAHQHKAIGEDRCHFVASAFLASDGSDRTGRLFLTDRRVLFMSTPMVSVSWGSVVSVDVVERDLLIDANRGGPRYRFRCNSFSDARCGQVIAMAIKSLPAAAPTARRDSSATAVDDPPESR
jgi:hypothetical protein